MGMRGQRIIRIDLTCQTDHERGTQVYTHTHTAHKLISAKNWSLLPLYCSVQRPVHTKNNNYKDN